MRRAIYTRVSTEHGLDQEFNSLDAQYDAASAYIKSQAHDGWTLIRSRYDDGGYSGGSTDRPDLQRLLEDIRARKIDVIVVYKVDPLTRSLADFAKLVELFDAHGVSFVSVTQQFNTTTSVGRLGKNRHPKNPARSCSRIMHLVAKSARNSSSVAHAWSALSHEVVDGWMMLSQAERPRSQSFAPARDAASGRST